MTSFTPAELESLPKKCILCGYATLSHTKEEYDEHQKKWQELQKSYDDRGPVSEDNFEQMLVQKDLLLFQERKS